MADARKPSLTSVISSLRCAIERLQLAQGVESAKARQLTLDSYIGQVELLQQAFTSLADAVLEEIDSLAADRSRAQREHAAMSHSLQEMEHRVQSKLAQLSRFEERLDVKLGVVSELPGQVEGLVQQHATGQASLEALRKDVKRLHLQLGHVEDQWVLATSEAAVAPLNAVQRAQVRDFAGEQVQQQVPGLIANSVATHLAPMIDEAVDSSSRSLRNDVASTTELLAADLTRLTKDAAGLRGDVSALAGSLQQQQHELGGLAPRVNRLEALESSNPRASLRLVSALEGKVDSMVAQQVRYSKSVESVVSALVDDTVSLNKSTRHVEGLVVHQQGQLQDTKEALLRSAQVFSTLLKIPTPVSSALWSSTNTSPVRASLSATAAAVAATSGGLSGGSYSSPHSSPMRSNTTAGSASPLRGKYAAMLGAMS